jgi:hypothetical protein
LTEWLTLPAWAKAAPTPSGFVWRLLWEVAASVGPSSVDALLDDVQPNATATELSTQRHKVHDRPAETIQTGDLQRVAITKHTQNLVELRSARLRSAGMVNVDVFLTYASATQSVDLMVRILLGGRDAGVAKEHNVENTRTASIVVVVSRRELSTRPDPGNAGIMPSLPDASQMVV